MRVRQALLLFLTLLITIPGCATFHLAEHTDLLSLQRQRGVTSETLAVCEFRYEPQESKDTPLDAPDLKKWQSMVVFGLNQTTIFGDVVACSNEEIPSAASYVLNGRITRFRFQKNWVPTFFPVHLGMSFLTFSGYTLFGGPVTFTIARFAVEFELRRVDTDEIVVAFDRSYDSRRAVNIYSRGRENPYSNPNLVFSEVLQSAAIEMALALPDEPEPPPHEAPELAPSS